MVQNKLVLSRTFLLLRVSDPASLHLSSLEFFLETCFAPPSLPFFFNFKRSTLVPLFSHDFGTCFSLSSLTLALSYNAILAISRRVQLPWWFCLFLKGCMYFLKSFPRIR